MNIQQAVKKAMAEGKSIALERDESWVSGEIKITPTNTPDCCIIQAKGQTPGKRWNPNADDLTSDDWTVVN